MSGGDHCWFKRSTGKKRLVTRDDVNNDDDDDDDDNNNNNNNNNPSNSNSYLLMRGVNSDMTKYRKCRTKETEEGRTGTYTDKTNYTEIIN